ncbi:hypothetical protein A33Q_0979 [Indibacter alkaliphilus LW1]|uniref:SusE outer membrane protein domain-containing protein n=1 Tax=Indibacter alkaliphilus (strain CCUG 57479 / KCTC 22604 / LW1) TaxID=1189612 RepID=S2DM98_INDAL|nr:SusE domain-containing protein [Indibacter alkaliphilus]EOZ98325.1 hypothetical protein A33Q_0979 [Indibacter alkaliphilus LW1]
MRVLSKFLGLALALPLLWSCGEMDMPPIVQQTPSTITSPSEGSSIVLDQAESEDMLVFEVSQANFGTSGEVTYSIELDAPGNNFASPVAVGSSTTTTVEVKVGELNRRVLAEGLQAGTSGPIEFRVRAIIDRSLRDIVGSPVTINVTPYLDAVDFPALRVPGDYQSWNPGNDNTVLFSPEANEVYEGFVHILGGSGEFKFITGPEWDEFPDFGMASEGVLSEGGDNIKIPGEFGTYRVVADLNNLTYELERIGIWGIIGSATAGGWDTETPMTFDAAENILKITADLVEGEMKFRTNTWDQNYGGSDDEGVAGFDGPNIVIPADGTYTITLDFKTPGSVLYTVEMN